jgi:menaquinone-dependent protoporphyrinogen oxidase
MNKKVLVAYASKYGSTREIAETIAEAMRENDIMVDLSSADKVSEIRDYNAVILGSAIYVGNWPKSAVSFLKGNQKFLKEIPVWLFSSGPSGEGEPAQLVDGVLYPPSLKPLIEEINPVDITVFHGDINLTKISAMEKWAIKNVVKKPFGDYRDWNSIQKWTNMVMDGMKATGIIQ